MNLPSISIITVCYNSERTIAQTIASVKRQSYAHLDYLLVDGLSKDGTIEKARELLADCRHPYQIISERDSGMYDAMRKGVERARGEVVAILNADDRFEHDDCVAHVANAFDAETQAVLADVVLADGPALEHIVRYYPVNGFAPEDMKRGIMPPHAGFYARRALFEKLGSYRADYRLAGDFELMFRFLNKARIKTRVLPEVIVRMSTGGLSNRSLRHRIRLNEEVAQALRENGVSFPWLRVLTKIPGKLLQYLRRPANSGAHA